jgi:hypothetical protein
VWLDNAGNTLGGLAGAGWWLNGRQIMAGPGGAAVFWNGRVLGRGADNQLVSTDYGGGDLQVVDSRGATEVYSDGLDWAAFLATNPTTVYTSWGLTLPGGQVYGMWRGFLFGRPNYQSQGGLSCWRVGETNPQYVRWALPDAQVLDFYALDQDHVIWTDNTRRVQSYNMPPLPVLGGQTGPIYRPMGFLMPDGSLWLAGELDSTGLVLRPWTDPSNGYRLTAANVNTWGVCAKQQGTSVLFAWGQNQSETGAPILASASIQNPQMPLFSVAPIAGFAHGMGIAPFFPDRSCPGNAVVVVNKGDYRIQAPPGSKVIASLDSLDVATPPPDQLLGVLTEGDPTAGISRAAALKTRVFAIYDGTGDYDPAILNKLRHWDIPMVECYQTAIDQTPQNAASRWALVVRNLQTRWPGYLGLVSQAYTENLLLSVQAVLDLQVPVASLARQIPACLIIAPFADVRADGASAYPPIYSALVNLAEASPGLPVWPPIPGPPTTHRNLELLLQRSKMPISVVSSAQLNAVGSVYTVTISNPLDRDYESIGKQGDTLPGPTGSDCVLSIQPNNVAETRPKGTAGAYETCTKQSGCLCYTPIQGVAFLVPYDGK